MDTSVKLYILTYLIIIVVISFLVYVVVSDPPLEQNITGADTDGLPDNYFQTIPQWDSSQSLSSSNEKQETSNNLQISNLLLAGYTTKNIPGNLDKLGKCTVYTYENNYDVDIKPNLNNLFDSVNSGLAHQSQNSLCLDSDQIMAYQSIHKCQKTNCFSTRGNKISQGAEEIFPVNCQEDPKDGLPLCQGGIFSISLNFNQDQQGGIIDTNTVFLTVDSITLPPKIYNNLDQFNLESGIFALDENLDNGVSFYKTTINSQIYSSANYKQRFRIIRYTWQGGDSGYQVDPQGFFAEIIFRPLNLQLSYKDNSYIFIPKTDNSYEPTWLMLAPMDLSPKKVPTTQRANLTTTLSVDNTKITNIANENKFPIPGVDNKGKSITGLALKVVPPGGEIIDTSYTWDNGEDLYNVKYQKGLTKLTSGWSNDGAKWDDTTPDISQVQYKYTYIQGNTVTDDNTFYKTLFTLPAIKSEGIGKLKTTVYDFEIQVYGKSSDPNNYLSAYNILPGNYIIDNNVLWQKKDIFENICIFSDEYFFNKSYELFSFKQGENLTNFDISVSQPATYLTPKTGLLESIDYSNSTYDNNSGTSPFTVFINSNEVNGLGGTARFSLNFQALPAQEKLQIYSFNINDQGQNCKDLNNGELTAGSIKVKNISFKTQDQDLIYVDVGTSTSGGLTLKNVNLSSQNKQITSATVAAQGYGYNVGQTIYIVQIDSLGNILTEGLQSTTVRQLLDNLDDQKKLNSFKITKDMLVQIDTIANYNLMRGGVNIEEYEPNNKNIQYKYYNNDKNIIYNKSPPQIAFIDNITVGVELLELLKGKTDPSILEGFLNSSGLFFPPISGINYIKTMQFQSLNYNTEVKNEIDAIQPLVLGRFIPYSSFTYQAAGEKSATLYNSNYTQLIPYGIEHIYERYINPNSLPTI